MRPLLRPLALALAALPASAQSHHPGPVVLLGEQADPGLVPELAEPSRASVLLVVAAERSPQPLDARAWGGDERTRIARLAPAREARADRELLERLRAADRIALGPGAPKAWLDALLERERASAVLNALHEAWSGGATLVARGDSAALLSAAFAVHGPQELEWDVRNPRLDGGSRAAQGLGYQPWAMLDTGPRSGGGLERLVRSLCHERIELALWLPAEGALVVDLTRSRLRVHGQGEVLLLDARRARRSRGQALGVRLTVLPAGACWNAAERRVPLPAGPEPDPGRPPGEAPPLGEVLVEDVLDGRALARWLAAGPQPEARRWILADGSRRLVLRYDEGSRRGRIARGADDSSSAAWWVEGLACDLTPDGL